MITTIVKILKEVSKPRTILRTDFLLAENKKTVAIYNAHLSVVGINRTRTRQLQTVLNHAVKDTKLPIIITGDFNYFPYRRKKLENLMTQYRFIEATSDISYTIRYPNKKFAQYGLIEELAAKILRKYFNGRVKTDYTFFKNLKMLK